MSSLVRKPLLAASVLVPALLYLGYRWVQHRNQEAEEPESESQEVNQDLQLVLERLDSYKRSRLDTLEEEPKDIFSEELIKESVCEVKNSNCELLFEISEVEKTEVVDSEDFIVEPQTGDQDAIEVVEEERTKLISVEPVFACTDIRYRHIESVVKLSEIEVTEESIKKVTEQSIELVTEETIEKVTEESTEKVTEEIVEVTINMTGTETESTITMATKVPDVLACLQDALCSPPSPHSYSSSPVKSEAGSSVAEGNKSSSCEWSDLIEQDEREQKINSFQLDSAVLSSKLSGLELNVDGHDGRGVDSGVVSPSEEEAGDRHSVKNIKSRSQSGEDAGIGSEPGDVHSDPGIAAIEPNFEENQLLAYQFHIPDYLCGKLIGQQGSFIKKLKEDCRCNIILKEVVGSKPKKKQPRKKKDQAYGEGTIKLCCIEATRSNIDKCLDLLKEKFRQNPELSFEQTNIGEGQAPVNLNGGSVCLNLAEGIMHDVFVSSIVSGGHVFLQQPCHPTFFALERLDACMSRTYSQYTCPPVPLPAQINSVCVTSCDGGWYRCQIVAFDSETEMCDIKYLDYGGYHTVSAKDLRQIRTDFLSLPFQAIEVYLANIRSNDEELVSAFVLEELVGGQVVQARMIGTNEQGVPMVHLYRATKGQTTMVNRELVDRNCAHWLDTTIVKLESPLEHPSNSNF